MSIYEIALTTSSKQQTTLEQYKGKVLFIVNTATGCGLVKQFDALEKLSQEYKDDLVVLGFPSNDFLAQEPLNDDEIKEVCQVKFNVSFPLFSKAPILGPNKQPLYAKLIEAQPINIRRDEFVAQLKAFGIEAGTDEEEVLWNFEKFIVNRDGTKVTRFSPSVQPEDDEIIKVIKEYIQ